MKKITFAIAACTLFAFAACTSATDSGATDSVEMKRIADSIEAAKTPPTTIDTAAKDTTVKVEIKDKEEKK